MRRFGPHAALGIWLMTAGSAWAQLPTCSAVAWSACDLVFELTPEEDTERTELRVEFRSPHRDTLAIRGFRASAGRWVVRVAPNEAGQWDYRITSSVDRLNGGIGQVTGTESPAPGFVQVANIHHFRTQANQLQHLWMSAEVEDFLTQPRDAFEEIIVDRAAEGFTHLRVVIAAGTDLDEAAERIRAINAAGLVADVVLPVPTGSRREREAQVAEMGARFGALNITWAGIPAFESIDDGWALARETAQVLAEVDPYHHPITSMAEVTSAALLDEAPFNMLSYGTADPNVGAVEHQVYRMPQLNAGIHSRSDLWNATMNGQYPASSHQVPSEAREMQVWTELMGEARYWELEPYFDIDGARAIALEGVEYIIYVERPGPIEMKLEKHGYDVLWLNPATGDRIKGKGFNEDTFLGEPPTNDHDWVLRISREGRKEGMLKSYKFESRDQPLLQAVETRASELPFAVASPKGEISLQLTPFYELEITRPSRATRQLWVQWTAELATGSGGFRVVGTGVDGTMRLPEFLREPGVLSLHVSILNAFGKAYSLDRALRVTR